MKAEHIRKGLDETSNLRVNGIHKCVGQKGCNYSMLHEESELLLIFKTKKNDFITVGSIIPYLEPYKTEKDLYKMVGMFSPMLAKFSHEKFVFWARKTQLAERFLRIEHTCGESKGVN